ncbi:ferric reductase NAD binding domain-containing protein [Kalaharituber pfeilii]|nr:ferric reductase NAD binding domain-containing protein [Kalaharituber pfeilii]
MAALSPLTPRHLLIEDLDPNDIYVNPDLYNNNDIEVVYAQRLDPWRWTRGWTHAMGMMLFIMGIILIFALLYLQDLYIDSRRLKTAIANADKFTRQEYIHRSFLDRISTHLRSFTYRRRRGGLWRKTVGAMSLGLAAIILAGWLYPTLYVFTQRPYYQLYARYGPPGLAGRSGMIAVATTPFIIALGLKANAISAVTGVGHERLNVLHRWLGLLTFFMSIVHTLPFLFEPIRDQGLFALRDMLLHGKGNIYYWNGFAALGCLAWLSLASLHKVRQWAYEFFVHLHIICGVGYLAMLFWHCHNQLSSWHYLWATVVIWTTGLLYRFVFKTNWFSSSGRWFSGETGVLSRLTDNGIKITITTKTKWKPGQHVFLRIPEISWLDNHPFTIASVMREEEDRIVTARPAQLGISGADSGAIVQSAHSTDTAAKLNRKGKAEQESDERLARVRQNNRFGDAGDASSTSDDEYNDMVLVFKPYQGFTRRVFDMSRARSDVSLRVLLDGPYGGMPRKLESFDTVLLIAGGSGITPVVAHLQDLCRKIRKGKAVTRDVRIVWTVKRFESLEWFKDEISAAARSIPFGLVHCQYFVTEESPVEFCDYPVSATQQWPTSPVGGRCPDYPPVPALPGTAITTSERTEYFPAQASGFPSEKLKGGPACAQNEKRPTFAPKEPTVPEAAEAVVDSHPNPFTTPVHGGAADIAESHPNPFSTPVPAEKQQEPAAYPPSLPQPPPLPVFPGAVPRKKVPTQRPELRVSTASIHPLPTSEGITRCVDTTTNPNIAPDGQRLSYGPGDFGDEVMIEFGRPRLREGIRPWAEGFGRRTCVYVCGPEEMKIDVSNAVASLQMDIWRKENMNREEVYLHTETFGW